jgi:hypothetical protein
MSCLGGVYENIDNMLEKKREIISASESDPFEVFYNEVKDIVTKRWNKMTMPLHLLAYALHSKTIIRKCCLYLVEQPQTRIMKWYRYIRQL